MTVSLRPLLAIVLSALLVLTAQTMAMARGAPGPAGQVELCTGGGVVTITLDENGDPVGPAQFCPDCALHLLAALVPPQSPALRLPGHAAPTPVRGAATLGSPHLLLPGARAPPVLI